MPTAALRPARAHQRGGRSVTGTRDPCDDDLDDVDCDFRWRRRRRPASARGSAAQPAPHVRIALLLGGRDLLRLSEILRHSTVAAERRARSSRSRRVSRTPFSLPREDGLALLSVTVMRLGPLLFALAACRGDGPRRDEQAPTVSATSRGWWCYDFKDTGKYEPYLNGPCYRDYATCVEDQEPKRVLALSCRQVPAAWCTEDVDDPPLRYKTQWCFVSPDACRRYRIFVSRANDGTLPTEPSSDPKVSGTECRATD